MQNRIATTKDIDQIVKIHQDAFGSFFLTSLGADFLRFYYTSFVKNKETVCLVAVDDNEVIGFSAATTKSKGFNTRLICSNIMVFIGWSFKMMVINPRALLRLVKNLTKKSDSVTDDGEYAELFSIGVSSTYQGRGVGSLLLSETEALLLKKGVWRLSLTTDYENNDSAVEFYHRNGYKVLYVFNTYPNRKMYRFIKKIG